MKKHSWILIGLTCLLTGCSQKNTVWEDTKTMGRYLHRQGQMLWKQDVDSRMIESTEEFNGPKEEEFIPLEADDLKTQFTDLSVPQAKDVPGAIGSGIPTIEQFEKPPAHLATLFENIQFNLDDCELKTKQERQALEKIAHHMKTHTRLHISIAGHCDERASASYNLALGTRRANTVRNMLVKLGVNPNQIFTISYGKEMPLDTRSNEEAWAKNRRVEFKIFEKESSK